MVQSTRPLSPVQSWGATTLLQEHERRLSINSGLDRTTDDGTIGYQPDGSMPSNYPPDVTVTNRQQQECHTPSPTHQVPPPYDPPPYTSYPGSEDCPCNPGPDYTSYANTWDEPISGHLLNRGQNGPHNGPPIIPANGSALDRKRRNVTQV